MLSLKTTTALIAAISVIATASAVPAFIPQAFAQNNTVTAFQSNFLKKDIDQSQSQYVGTEDDDGGTSVVQSADQGFCEQTNQQNAAGGNVAANFASNEIEAEDDSFVDCS
jgi:hypothetical protein